MQQIMVSSAGPADSDARKPTIVAIGNSHIMAVWAANKLPEAKDLPFRVACLPSIVPKYQPHWVGEGNDRTLNPDFRRDARDLIEAERPIAVLCFASGSFGFATGAFNSPRPFDFVIPGREDPGLIQGSEIVPYDLVVQAALMATPWWSQVISTARASAPAPVYSVCVPPPVASFDPFLPALGHAYTKSKIERLGVAPSPLRYKTWYVQMEADAQKAAAMGADFLRPPAGALDAAGFRRADFSGDLIHANAAYGLLILRQLAERVHPIPDKEG